jgi:hypothetical protein
MLFGQNMKRSLAARGYHHCKSDEEFTRHGDYARNIQCVYSKEFKSPGSKVVDLIFLAVDVMAERLVISLFRENVSIENGVLINADAGIPLVKFSIEEFEKQLDRLIPKGEPVSRHGRKVKF